MTGDSPATLSRTTVLASSNGGAAVNFSAGTKDVFQTAAADYLTQLSNALSLSPQTSARNVIQPTEDVVPLIVKGDSAQTENLTAASSGSIVNQVLYT